MRAESSPRHRNDYHDRRGSCSQRLMMDCGVVVHEGPESLQSVVSLRGGDQFVDPDHVRFLKAQARDCYETDEFIFVHACYDLNKPMAEQSNTTPVGVRPAGHDEAPSVGEDGDCGSYSPDERRTPGPGVLEGDRHRRGQGRMAHGPRGQIGPDPPGEPARGDEGSRRVRERPVRTSTREFCCGTRRRRPVGSRRPWLLASGICRPPIRHATVFPPRLTGPSSAVARTGAPSPRIIPSDFRPEREPDLTLPGTGAYYWVPVPTGPGHHRDLLTSRDAGLNPDVGHTELWLFVLDRLAIARGKDRRRLRLRFEDRYAGLPRGRVTRPSGTSLILHGRNGPLIHRRSVVAERFDLAPSRMRFVYDEHANG